MADTAFLFDTDPFADEAGEYDFPACAAIAPSRDDGEDDTDGRADWLDTLLVNSAPWQGDCREWQ